MRICWIIKQLSCSILRNIPWFSQLGLRPRRLSIRRYSARFRRIIVKYCTILQISNRVVQGRGKGQDYTVLEALGLDLLSPPSPNAHTVFSQLNAPGVYHKLGMVDSAFLCMNKQLIWACHVLRKGYYSFSWQPCILPLNLKFIIQQMNVWRAYLQFPLLYPSFTEVPTPSDGK